MLDVTVHDKWNTIQEGGSGGSEVAPDLYELCALAARNASMIHLAFDFMMGISELGFDLVSTALIIVRMHVLSP